MLYELYDDDAAVQAHLQAPHFIAMSQRTASWVDSKTVWRQRRISP
jgi:quinol monooxygenase YgiN